MNKLLALVVVVLLSNLVVLETQAETLPSQAKVTGAATAPTIVQSNAEPQASLQGPPGVSTDLLDALSVLPIDEFSGYADKLIGKLRQYSPNGYAAKEGPFVLNIFLNGNNQTVVLGFEATTHIPDSIMDESLSEQLGPTELRDPLFVISLSNSVLMAKDMSPDLQAIIKRSYFGVPGLDLRKGIQVIARAGIKGFMGSMLKNVTGVPAENFILSAGRLIKFNSIPSAALGTESNSDATQTGDEARLIAKQARNRANKRAAKKAAEKAGTKVPKEPPEYFVQFQTAPGTVVKGPLGMSKITLRDATFFASSLGTFGYKGNVIVHDLPQKPFLTFFEVPYDAAGAIKLTDIKFGMAMPSLNLAEASLIARSFATPNAPGGNFLPKIDVLKTLLTTMNKPLSAFELINPYPGPLPEYRYGDPNHTFPPASAFNMMLLGPFAQETLGGRVVKGPYLKIVGNARVLGQTMGSMDISFSEHGLHGDTQGKLRVNLSAVGLGTPGINVGAGVHIDEHTQGIALTGPIPVPDPTRNVTFSLDSNNVIVRSDATCLTPIGVNIKLSYNDFNLDNLPLKAVTPDFEKLAHCGGDLLLKGGEWLGQQTFKGAKEAYEAGKKTGKFVVRGAEIVGTGVVKGADVVGSGVVSAASTIGGFFKHHNPAPRGVFDCVVFQEQDAAAARGQLSPDQQKMLATENHGGRLWFDQFEFDKVGMGMRRYIYSVVDKKFHQVADKGVFQKTWCGDIEGVDGIRRGGHNLDDIWSHAYSCLNPVDFVSNPSSNGNIGTMKHNKASRPGIPPEMIGAAITTTEQCYAVRGMSKTRPDWDGKVFHIDHTYFLVGTGGYRHLMTNVTADKCGKDSGEDLDNVFAIPINANDPANSQSACARISGADAKFRALKGQLLWGSGKNPALYLIDTVGVKHWVSINGWDIGQCGYPDFRDSRNWGRLGQGQQAVVDLMPEGSKVNTLAQCRAVPK